jgi:uncharacterized protein YjiS (DUF1127 family)
MICGLRPTGLIETSGRANDRIWSRSMSTFFSYGGPSFHIRGSAAVRDHQSNSWRRLLENCRLWDERRRQRAALRDIADDPYLLHDLGLTREDALDEASKPFWR